MDSPNIISIREHIQSHRICQNQDSNCFFSHSKVHAFSSTFYSPPLFFLLKDFLKIQTIFKVLTEFVIILLLFYVYGFFGHKACGILAPWPGIEPTLPPVKGEVPKTGAPGKSHTSFLFKIIIWWKPLQFCKCLLLSTVLSALYTFPY